jgi:hypothetical protein
MTTQYARANAWAQSQTCLLCCVVWPASSCTSPFHVFVNSGAYTLPMLKRSVYNPVRCLELCGHDRTTWRLSTGCSFVMHTNLAACITCLLACTYTETRPCIRTMFQTFPIMDTSTHMAVLPTPASPIRTGLFFVRLDSTCEIGNS